MLSKNAVVCAMTLASLAGTAAAQLCPDLTRLDKGASASADGNLGRSISMSFGGLGNLPLLAVGEPGLDSPVLGPGSGGFTVYQKANGWSVLFGIQNNSGQAGEALGASIGLCDPFLIAGAPNFDFGRGRAKIYRRPSNGSGYAFNADLLASNGNASARFGSAVAVSSVGGGWAVVGAPQHSIFGVDAGAAFFYTRNDVTNVWSEAFHIWGGDFGGSSIDHRGAAVAMSQTTPYAAAGSPDAEASGQPLNHGVVTIVQRFPNGIVSGQVVQVRPPSPEAEEHFGSAVAIEGSLLVVGAPDEDLTLQESGFTQQASSNGAIYIFQRNGSAWDFVSKHRSPTPITNGHFGAKVSTDGVAQIMVSEPGTKRAYLLALVDGAWRLQAAFSDPDSAAQGSFGSDVAVRQGEIAIGDQLDDLGALSNAGAVYAARLDADVRIGDLCSDPLPIPAGDYLGCTELATASQSSGFITTCGSGGSGPDVWFSFQPACDGNAIFDTFGSGFDTVLSVHDGCPGVLGVSNTIACNDDAGFAAPNNRASLVTFNFTAGQSYMIRVAGFNAAKGQFVLRHLYTYGVSNDTCATASTTTEGATTFNTCSASTENSAGPTCTGAAGVRDVWYRFIAPHAGRLEADTCGSSFDTVLVAYNGSQQDCPSSLADAIACNDDAGAPGCNPRDSRVVTQVSTGQSILFRVAGYNSAAFGPGVLNINYLPPCLYDFNHDGVLDPDDLADYIACFFGAAGDASQCPGGDINHDAHLDPDDLADYIAGYFGGCP